MSRLLHTSSGWIREITNDLQSFVEDFNGHGDTAQVGNVVRANWESLYQIKRELAQTYSSA